MCNEHCHNHEHKHNHNTLFFRAAAAFVLFVAGFKFAPAFILAYLIIGYDIIFKALKNIVKGEMFDECFLMALATVGAICIKELPEAVMVMFLYQIGEYLQHKAVEKSKKSISNLMDIRPDYANIITENTQKKIHPEEVKIGDIILVKTGEKIPLDGKILEGNASLDTSSLTGEALPRSASAGDDVFSGCINLDGVLKIEVTKTFENSAVSKILEMVEHAKAKKTKTENFITRFAKIYTPVVVVLALIIAFIPPLFVEGNWFERALTFLVISCPCALVISVPLGFFAGIGKCSKTGILVKGSTYLEKLSKIKAAVFDKTGTLTNGKFEVVKVNGDPDTLKYAALAEANSNHPIALAIKKACPLEPVENLKIQELAGLGIKAEIEGEEILVGNSKLTGAAPLNTSGTVIYVSKNGTPLGNIVIKDTLKQNSKELIQELNRRKIKTVMLTGDIEAAAKEIQTELNLNEAHAGLLPNEKVEKLEEIMKSSKGTVAFTGDGINDAPVLQRADIGISMGGLGSDAAIEASDIVIMDDNPAKILEGIKISQKTMVIVKENIFFAIFIKLLFLMLGAFGFMTMWGAVFADVGVTFLAILNALRIFNKSLQNIFIH